MKYIIMSPVRNGYCEGERFDSEESIEQVITEYSGTFEFEPEYCGEPVYFIFLDDDSGYADWSYDPYGD